MNIEEMWEDIGWLWQHIIYHKLIKQQIKKSSQTVKVVQLKPELSMLTMRLC